MKIKENKLQTTLLYKGFEGAVTLDVVIDNENETLWVTQKSMAKTFNVQVPAISKHLKNIFEDEELDENSVVSKMEITASDGKNYNTKFYNLDAIISVGYRVNSKQATDFRIWATNVLKEYMVKGFVLDDELLKNGSRFGRDYFDKLLERVREIRVSERRVYQKITDLYALSYDYNDNPKITRDFFVKVQNKVIYAVSGKTAPEIIVERADADEINMGLITWEGSPKTKIHASDVVISKNYLNETELKTANKLVDGFLTTAEMRVETHRQREKPLLLKDWAELLDNYILLNDFNILDNKGKVSRKNADKIAMREYDKYRPIQDKLYKSDHDKRIEEVTKLINKIENKNKK
ncbi:MAG: virulence RhuM family protein [Methanobrevibacter sp.]|jgi:hypothetical protein|nr:virulence RhuM family protein [Candidatus Methanoflexus mossambicus]